MKNMINTSFFEIFYTFLDRLNFDGVESLHLPALRVEVLEDAGYEVSGDKLELHAYEKEIFVPYQKRSVGLLHKLYFFADEKVGSGIGVGPKVRLATLLKAYWSYRALPRGESGPLAFYFWEGYEDGAVIIEEKIVVFFGSWRKKGAYVVSAIESGLDESGKLPGFVVDTVKRSMSLYRVDCDGRRENVKGAPVAFLRFVDFICSKR